MANISEALQEVLEKLASELPGFIASGITDNKSGMVLAGVIRDPSFKIEVAGAFFTEAYLKQFQAVKEVGGGLMKEILITGENQLHLMTTLKGGKYHQGICVDSSTTLGLLRVMTSKFQQEIEKLL